MLPFLLPAVLMTGTAVAVAVAERLGRDKTYVHPDVLDALENQEQDDNTEDVVIDFNHPSRFDWVNKE